MDWAAAVVGILGLLLMAVRPDKQLEGWTLFLCSSIGWFIVGMEHFTYGLCFSASGYMIAQLIGIYKCLNKKS